MLIFANYITNLKQSKLLHIITFEIVLNL